MCLSVVQIQNMTSETVLKIDLLHLHRNTQYFVKVRAIPLKELEGVWSEWSNTYTFRLPEGEDGIKLWTLETGDGDVVLFCALHHPSCRTGV